MGGRKKKEVSKTCCVGDEVGPATGKLASTQALRGKQTRRPDSRYIFKPLANRLIFKTI